MSNTKDGFCPACSREYIIGDWEWITSENKIQLFAHCECGAEIEVTYNVTLADITII